MRKIHLLTILVVIFGMMLIGCPTETSSEETTTTTIASESSSLADTSDSSTAAGDSSSQNEAADSSSQYAGGDSSSQRDTDDSSSQNAGGDSSSQRDTDDSSSQNVGGDSSSQRDTDDSSSQYVGGDSSSQNETDSSSSLSGDSSSSDDSSSQGGTQTVDAATPTFTTDLSETEVTYTVGDTATALTVTASVTDNGTLSYQWKSSEDNQTFTDIAEATSNTYVPAAAAIGTTYYQVVVTNINDNATGNKTAAATSKSAKITVNQAQLSFIPVTYDKMGENYNDNDTSWTTWDANLQYITIEPLTTTETGYSATVKFNTGSMKTNESSNEEEAAIAGDAFYAAFNINFGNVDVDGMTISYGTKYQNVAIASFFDAATNDGFSGYIDWFRLVSYYNESKNTVDYTADGKTAAYTFKKDGYRDTTLTITFVREFDNDKSFIPVTYSAFPNNIMSDDENDATQSWSTWNSNADEVTVSQIVGAQGFNVTVTYNSANMGKNTSSDSTMASKYGEAVWAVTGTLFDDADGVTVLYGNKTYDLIGNNGFFFGVTENDNIYWDWWLLNSAEDQGTETYDRNGKSTTLTFKKDGYADTVVKISFVDTTE